MIIFPRCLWCYTVLMVLYKTCGVLRLLFYSGIVLQCSRCYAYGSAKYCITEAEGSEKKAEPTVSAMVTLGERVFRGKAEQAAYEKLLAGRYMRLLKRNHFLYFGMPFLLLIVAGLVFLLNFTQMKWERYDNKYQQLEEDAMLGMLGKRRAVDRRTAYYLLQGYALEHEARAAAEQDYEMVRLQRAPGDEPVWDKKGKS